MEANLSQGRSHDGWTAEQTTAPEGAEVWGSSHLRGKRGTAHSKMDPECLFGLKQDLNEQQRMWRIGFNPQRRRNAKMNRELRLQTSRPGRAQACKQSPDEESPAQVTHSEQHEGITESLQWVVRVREWPCHRSRRSHTPGGRVWACPVRDKLRVCTCLRFQVKCPQSLPLSGEVRKLPGRQRSQVKLKP